MKSVSYHLVQPGDTIYRIMRDHYGTDRFLSDKTELTAAMKAVNPRMTDINLIRPGQIVVLPPVSPERACLEVLPVGETAAIQNAASTLGRTDPLALHAWVGLAPKTGGDFATRYARGSLEHIQKVATEAVGQIDATMLSYRLRQRGHITANQYQYRRRVRLEQLDKQLGILRHGITPGKTTREILRVERNATNRLHRHIGQVQTLERITKVAKNGVVVLKVADVADKVAKVALAKDDKERTVVLLDQIGATGGAVAGVAGLKAVLFVAGVSTPMGWVGIACFGLVAAIGGGAGELISKAIQNEMLYDAQGRRMDTLLDRIWSVF